jgi:hypothetical protein
MKDAVDFPCLIFHFPFFTCFRPRKADFFMIIEEKRCPERWPMKNVKSYMENLFPGVARWIKKRGKAEGRRFQ